jgi:hypothetical protein
MISIHKNQIKIIIHDSFDKLYQMNIYIKKI